MAGPKNAEIAGLEDLYGLPLGDFTAARNALAKRLRGEGDPEAGKEVAAARKPTTAAWAVNQLLRQEPDRVRELLEIGEQLREAQASLVAGGDRGDTLALSERERRLVEQLLADAGRILEQSGARPSEATLEEIRDTLHAAAVDEEAAAAVGSGRLTKERRAIGFGLGTTATGSRPAGAGPKAASSKAPTRLTNARRRLEAARSAADEARQKAGEAEHRLAETRKAADAATREVRRAEAAARQARRSVEQAAERERKSREALERASG